MTALPEAYVRRMRAQLGDEAAAYFAALEAPYTRGLRLNPAKPAALGGLAAVPAVPWEPLGRYLPPESRAGALALHEAGAYYLQEPSAMAPARVLAPAPGMRVLDLCAAPGGKSTQLAALLAGEGLLVCNEPIPARAQVLSRNVERMGVPNALVTCAYPDRLAALWPGLFDAVLVDAPCSGEGMFRRHPETRLEWDEGAPARCAARQREILEAAVRLLAPGGRLCYATCTLNREEDEGVAVALLAAHPELRAVPFALPAQAEAAEPGAQSDACPTGALLAASGENPNIPFANVSCGTFFHAPEGWLKLYPHQVRGEGHFMALFEKANDSDEVHENVRTSLHPAERALAPVSKPAREAFARFCEEAGFACPYPPTALLGDALVSLPALPPVDGVRVLRAGVRLGECRAGVRLGECRAGRFEPDHALAMALRPPYPLAAAPLTEAQTRRFLQGEALPVDELAAVPRAGYVLATYAGLALGWAKHAGGLLKNHYPKGLRRAVAPEGE